MAVRISDECGTHVVVHEKSRSPRPFILWAERPVEYHFYIPRTEPDAWACIRRLIPRMQNIERDRLLETWKKEHGEE